MRASVAVSPLALEATLAWTSASSELVSLAATLPETAFSWEVLPTGADFAEEMRSDAVGLLELAFSVFAFVLVLDGPLDEREVLGEDFDSLTVAIGLQSSLGLGWRPGLKP